MSWNVYLQSRPCPTCHDVCYFGEWNYTHNTNRMAHDVLGINNDGSGAVVLGLDRNDDGSRKRLWVEVLDGMDGPEGAEFLDRIITGLRADPDRYRAMNPDNGWGDYDSFVAVLESMRDAVPERPCVWSVSP